MEDRPPLVLSSPVRSGSTTIGPLSLSRSCFLSLSLSPYSSLSISLFSQVSLSVSLSRSQLSDFSVCVLGREGEKEEKWRAGKKKKERGRKKKNKKEKQEGSGVVNWREKEWIGLYKNIW
jgi:hypothetical protein